MAEITFSIDTKDLYEEGFESVVVNQITQQLSANFKCKAKEMLNAKVNKMIEAAVNYAVENKLKSLMDEPVVISDRWGKKKFLGTAEDYIKQEIDSKLLKPVDNAGKELHGCTSTSQTWIEWSIAKTFDLQVKRVISEVESRSKKHFSIVAKEALEKGIDEAASKAVSDTIAALLKKKK